MPTPTKIFVITLSSFLLGAAVLFGFVSGPMGILVSPLLSAFGIFYFPLVYLAVTVMWKIYTPAMKPLLRRVLFILGWGVIGATTMHFWGIREEGGLPSWTLGYLLGGGLAACLAAFLVTRWRTYAA